MLLRSPASALLSAWLAFSLLAAPVTTFFCPMHRMEGAATAAADQQQSDSHSMDHQHHGEGEQDQHNPDSEDHHSQHQHCDCQWCCTGVPPVATLQPTFSFLSLDATEHHPIVPTVEIQVARAPPAWSHPPATAPPSLL